ncbi:hypothetical protein OROMI_032041 [Orobanche minor]
MFGALTMYSKSFPANTSSNPPFQMERKDTDFEWCVSNLLFWVSFQRIEEDSGPSIRRLYQELLVLWPTGFMDIDGIKRALYRAKERRELCSSRKDRDKIRKKKLLPPKSEDVSKGTKALHTSEKPLSDSCSTLNKKPVLSAGHGGVAFANGPKVDRRKQEKAKINPNGNNPIDEMQSNILSKKKMKKKPSTEALEGGKVSSRETGGFKVG